MKVIKNINNNVALCLDSRNTEVVVFGKGVGFTKPPYEIDEHLIQRIYYDVDKKYYQLIQDLSPEIIKISAQIIDYAKEKLENPINSNVTFTLADHIQFAIKRQQENMDLKLPILYDIQYFYKEEIKVAEKALELIRQELNIRLPKHEAGYIALHLLNNQKKEESKARQKFDDAIIEDITIIIEQSFHLQIDKDSFNYSRFVSHMQYLLKRGKSNELFQSDNHQLYDSIQKTFPKTKECSLKIAQYLELNGSYELSEEEILYLMLHINRLCVREDCY